MLSAECMPSPAVQVIEELYAAFGRRDVPAVLRLFSPEIEIAQSAELPWGGVYRGHTGALAFFGKLTERINSTVTVERMLDAGDRVVVLGWTRGTVKATGASYDVPIAHVWEVRDSLAVRVEFFIDNPTMLKALAAPAA